MSDEENRARCKRYYHAHIKNNPAKMKAKAVAVTLWKRKKRAATIKVCLWCGIDFTPTHLAQKYHSEKCRAERNVKAGSLHSKIPSVKLAILRHRMERRRSSVELRLKHSASESIRASIKRNGGCKKGRIRDALPYSIPQLKAHLESQFDNSNGFAWENYGKSWEIDHIIPHSLFHYTELDSKAFRDCWALNNLRPLGKLENRVKSNKLVS